MHFEVLSLDGKGLSMVSRPDSEKLWPNDVQRIYTRHSSRLYFTEKVPQWCLPLTSSTRKRILHLPLLILFTKHKEWRNISCSPIPSNHLVHWTPSTDLWWHLWLASRLFSLGGELNHHRHSTPRSSEWLDTKWFLLTTTTHDPQLDRLDLSLGPRKHP